MSFEEFLQAALRFFIVLGLLLVFISQFWAKIFAAQNNEQIRLRPVVWLGASLVVLASSLDVWFVLHRIFGGYAFSNLFAYLGGAQHGQLSLLRLGLLLVFLGLGNFVWAQVVLGLALLLTLSFSAHAASNGLFAVIMDFIHVSAMCAWVGAVAGLALVGKQNNFSWRLRRVSGIGLVALGLMSLTGVVAVLRHIFVPAVLSQTSYGQAFSLKMFLVLIVLALAAYNRFVLMKQKTIGSQFFVLKAETFVLLLVLAASTWLGVQPPPQPSITLRNPQSFDEKLGEWRVVGEFTPNFGGMHLSLKALENHGVPTRHDFLTAKLNMLDHAMLPTPIVLKQSAKQSALGEFEADNHLWMGGNWEAVFVLPSGTVRVPLRAN